MYATHAALDCMHARDGGDINIVLIARLKFAATSSLKEWVVPL